MNRSLNSSNTGAFGEGEITECYFKCVCLKWGFKTTLTFKVNIVSSKVHRIFIHIIFKTKEVL
jgi:hypothetical protein